ncbi:MAG TPA: hypothetical protein VFD82_08570 [Planctomycetota bacterium]|nr:hypothetical protein [Planctomycetota bacterium]
MNQRAPLLFLLCSLSLQASATAQIPPSLPELRKTVVHDHGGLWPESFALYIDGSVGVHGNPWLGGGWRSLLSGGVTDLARLDALTLGDSEAVVMVGASGLVTARWNHTAHGFDLETWSHPLLLNALMVRAAPFAPQHLVVVLAEDGQTLRVFRHGATAITSFTITEPVLDYEIVRNASGAARLFVVTSFGLSCRQPGGTVEWSLPGIGGQVVRWPKDPTTRAAWLHRDMASGAWQIARLGDSGALGFDAIGDVIDNEQELLAAFPVDGDADGDVDWIVKSSSGLSVLRNDGANQFALANWGPVLMSLADPDSIPDLVVTHGGTHVYVVDDHGFTALSWNGIDMIDGNGWDDGIDLLFEGTVDTAVEQDTKVDFPVKVGASWLEPFVKVSCTTHLQVVGWRQLHPVPGGRLDDAAESNVMFPLLNPPPQPSGETHWPLTVTMNPAWNPNDWDQEYYWLTVRLVLTGSSGDLLDVSDPVTFATSLSASEMATNWAYLRNNFLDPMPPSQPLPPVRAEPDGGVVVGVIVRIKLPPPPPASGLPSPMDASPGASLVQLPQGP